MVLNNGIAIDTNTGRMTSNFNASLDSNGQKAWQSILKDTSLTDVNNSPVAVDSVSSPAFVIYSDDEFKTANPSGTSITNQNQWLTQHANILVVNAYTGTVIR